jgi:energy-coupling factor transporter ATP-binding protein EcfA2
MRDDTLPDGFSRSDVTTEAAEAFVAPTEVELAVPPRAGKPAHALAMGPNGPAPVEAFAAAPASRRAVMDTAMTAEIDLSVLEPSRAPAPRFPIEHVPERLRKNFIELAAGSRTSIDYLATASWPVIAAAAGTSVYLRIAEGIYEPCLSWSLLVGEPGSGKSNALKLVAGALKSIDLGYASAQVPLSPADEDPISADGKNLRRTATREAVPRGNSRHCVTDVSIAAIMDQLMAQPRGLLVHRDEILGLVRGNLTRGGHQGRAVLLEAYDGQPYDYVRHDRSLPVPALHLSILGGIQPDKISTLMGRDDDGFAARCLMAWPDVERDPRLPTGIVSTVGLAPVLRRLVEMPTRPPFQGHPVGLCAKGRETSEKAARTWLAMARYQKGPLQGVYVRAQQAMLRLALVMELGERAASGLAGAPDQVSPRMVVGAAMLIHHYYLPCAERVLSGGQENGEEDLRRLASFIAHRGEAAFNARELRRSSGCPVREPRQFTALLQQLEASGILRRVPHHRTGPGRPAEEYEVHPGLRTALRSRQS